jgi:signal peptidase II
MTIVRRLLLILFVLVSCVGCDQATKSIAASRLPLAQTRSYLGDTVRLQLMHNECAFLSMGASLPKAWRQGLLRLGVACMLIGLLAAALFYAPPRHAPVVALSLMLAGGVSNLIDRFVNDGYVVDFLNLGIGTLRTGIFNVADVALMAGVFMLLLGGLQHRRALDAQHPRAD